MRSLWYFNTEVLGVSSEVAPFMADPAVKQYLEEVGKEILDWRQNRHLQPSFRKMLVVVPRETMKTTCVTEGGILWANCLDHNIGCILSSANFEGLAVPMAGIVKDHWEQNEKLNSWFGPFWKQRHGKTWSSSFMNTAARTQPQTTPSLFVTSVKTGGTSKHADLVILDDPITKEMVEEFGNGWYDKVWTHYESLKFVVKKDGLLIVVMTRYGEGDFVGQVIEKEIKPVVSERVQPGAPRGELPTDFDKYWWKYAPLAGWKVVLRHGEYDSHGNRTITFPVVWPQERIDEVKLSSPVFAATQINNMPAKRDDNPITDEQIARIWCTADEIPQSFRSLVLLCDWAWKDPEVYMKARGDYNVIFAVGLDYSGGVWLLKGWHSRTATQAKCGEKLVEFWQWAESQDRTFQTMVWDKPRAGVSDESIRAWATGVLHSAGYAPYQILTVTNPGNKVGGEGKWAKIMASNAMWQEFPPRVHILRGVQGGRELTEQMCQQTIAYYDDHADAFANVWHKQIYQPGKKGLNTAFGRQDKSTGWTSAVEGLTGTRFNDDLEPRLTDKGLVFGPPDVSTQWRSAVGE